MNGWLFFSLIRPMFRLLARATMPLCPVAYALVRAAPTLVSSFRLFAATPYSPSVSAGASS
jgi:hypothetical protein